MPKRVSGRPTFPMVDAAALLHADAQAYAAYPDGIPEGEPFALFLGRQIREYCRDIGFDYVWLSNGFGFSAVAWDYLGPGFDGEHFLPEERARISGRFKKPGRIFIVVIPRSRWKYGVPTLLLVWILRRMAWILHGLYDSGYVRLPPPNSPWGALNFDFGLEIAGYPFPGGEKSHGRVSFPLLPQ